MHCTTTLNIINAVHNYAYHKPFNSHAWHNYAYHKPFNYNALHNSAYDKEFYIHDTTMLIIRTLITTMLIISKIILTHCTTMITKRNAVHNYAYLKHFISKELHNETYHKRFYSNALQNCA